MVDVGMSILVLLMLLSSICYYFEYSWLSYFKLLVDEDRSRSIS